MKTYRGFKGPPEARVTVDDGGGLRIIKPGNPLIGFSWGKGAGWLPARQLAMAIATDLLGNEDEAASVCTRLMHRTVLAWDVNKDWHIDETALFKIIDDIKKVESDYAPVRRMVDQQPAPVVNEGGGGITRSQQDQGPGSRIERQFVDNDRRKAALAKLTPEEREALGLR